MNRSSLNKSIKKCLTLFYKKESNHFEKYPNEDEEVSGEGSGDGEKN